MSMREWVIPENFEGVSTAYLIDGECPYSKKRKEDFLEEGYRIVSDEELDKITVDYEDSLCGHWEEISPEKYFDFLDSVPPIRFSNGGFFVGESQYGEIYKFCQEKGDKCYASLQRISTPRNEILVSLDSFIREQKEMIHEKTEPER